MPAFPKYETIMLKPGGRPLTEYHGDQVGSNEASQLY